MGVTFRCDDCGCNMYRPSNSNFVLVAGASSLVLAKSASDTMATGGVLQVMKAAYHNDPDELGRFIDLAEFESSRIKEEGLIQGLKANNDAMNRNVMDVLEDMRNQLNTVEDDEGNTYCPTCGPRHT